SPPPADCETIPRPFSRDPNDILGPAGFGDDAWVPASSTLGYRIDFENAADATAPARAVTITQALDPDLDPRPFRLADCGFGGMVFQVPANQSFYSKRIDLRDTLGVFVDVNASIDVQNDEAVWQFVTIDPATGEQPIDPRLGFLPVNAGADLGKGEGFVSYTVKAGRAAPSGTRSAPQARMVSDNQGPIDPPSIVNPLDAEAPTSAVDPLTATPPASTFHVTWSGRDPAGGSALASYRVYVSTNG